ncbi:MAG: amidohydrolase [Polyangiales bacterium]
MDRLSTSWLALSCLLAACVTTAHADPGMRATIDARAKQLESSLIALRRDFHAHPELGNREQRTSARVAERLRALGLEVRTGVARTGVVAVLRGGKPGRVVALRADMDGLPVKEQVALPFASTDKGDFRGRESELMHACGHDGHVAILLTVAEILAGMRARLPGTVVFYFQPAEEGPSDFTPDGKNVWGAKMMIQEGAMDDPRPAAVFALHLWAGEPAGRITYRSGPTMASSDDLRIRIVGKQTHAGRPWAGIDPIVVSAQVVLGLQTIISRQTDITSTPTVVSVGTIHGGTRYNIIPESVEMEGTIRAYQEPLRRATHERVRRTATHIAEASGAQAEVQVIDKYDVTVNDAALTERSLPSLRWAAANDVVLAPLGGGAEDFSFMAERTPGFFFHLGVTPRSTNVEQAAPNHSPLFYVDESALIVGVRALAALATDFLTK